MYLIVNGGLASHFFLTLHLIVLWISSFQLYNKGRLCPLAMEFSELDTFARVLKVNDKRYVYLDHDVTHKVCPFYKSTWFGIWTTWIQFHC